MKLEKTNNLPESDPRHHAMNISHALKELGLAKAHDDFANGNEEAMRKHA